MGTRKFEKIGNYKIYLDDVYYLAYTGGARELGSKEQKEWDKTELLPGLLQVKERNKLGLDKNPNVVPLRGVQLMEFIKDLNFIPMFDRAFQSTHLLKLTDLIAYEYIKQHSGDYFRG